MDIVVVKISGVVFLAIVFIVTVLLMPRIFGVDPPSTTASEPAAVPPPATVAAPPVPQPSERPLRG